MKQKVFKQKLIKLLNDIKADKNTKKKLLLKNFKKKEQNIIHH